MARPTKKRLDKIRHVTATEEEVDVCYFCIDLLAEIDALEKENYRLSEAREAAQHYKEECARLKDFHEEREELLDESIKCLDGYKQENDSLKERVEGLRAKKNQLEYDVEALTEKVAIYERQGLRDRLEYAAKLEQRVAQLEADKQFLILNPHLLNQD